MRSHREKMNDAVERQFKYDRKTEFVEHPVFKVGRTVVVVGTSCFLKQGAVGTVAYTERADADGDTFIWVYHEGTDDVWPCYNTSLSVR